MKSFLIIAACILLSIQCVQGQTTYTASLMEYANWNCTQAYGPSPVEPVTSVVAGVCTAASGVTKSVLATCGTTPGLTFYPYSASCNSSTSAYVQQSITTSGCATLVWGTSNIYVQITCMAQSSASTVSVSVLLLAALAMAAQFMKF